MLNGDNLSDDEVAQEITNNSNTPDSIIVELPKFDQKFIKHVGEYTVESKKVVRSILVVFGVQLYKKIDEW